MKIAMQDMDWSLYRCCYCRCQKKKESVLSAIHASLKIVLHNLVIDCPGGSTWWHFLMLALRLICVIGNYVANFILFLSWHRYDSFARLCPFFHVQLHYQLLLQSFSHACIRTFAFFQNYTWKLRTLGFKCSCSFSLSCSLS